MLTMILIGIRDWIASNRDALIVEAMSIALTVGLIEAVLRWRERRKWFPTKRTVGLQIATTLEAGLMEILELSPLSWSDVVPRDGPGYRRIIARFFGQQYEHDFDTKYHNVLRQASHDELARFSKYMGDVVTDLDRGIDVAGRLFGPEVMQALLDARRLANTAQELMYRQIHERPCDRDFFFVPLLASKLGRALALICDNID